MNIFQIRNIRNKQTINKNRWTLQFNGLEEIMLRAAKPDAPKHIRDRYEAVKYALKDGDIDISTGLELSLKKVSLPSVKLESVDITRFNDSIKALTKFAAMEEMSVSFYDYVNGSASAIMQLWHAFVGDKRTGAIGFKEDFVLRQAFFYVYGPDAPGYQVSETGAPAEGEVREVPWLQKYEIWNLYPSSINLGEHGDDPAPREVECTFIIDNIFPIGVRGYVGTPGNRSYSDIPSTAEGSNVDAFGTL